MKFSQPCLNTMHTGKQVEAEVVPSSSLVEVEVEVGVCVVVVGRFGMQSHFQV